MGKHKDGIYKPQSIILTPAAAMELIARAIQEIDYQVLPLTVSSREIAKKLGFKFEE